MADIVAFPLPRPGVQTLRLAKRAAYDGWYAAVEAAGDDVSAPACREKWLVYEAACDGLYLAERRA